MAISAFSGSVVQFPSGVNTGEPAGQNPEAGPIYGQHGTALLDIRPQFTYQPGGTKAFYGFGATRCLAIDQVPSTIVDNNIAASQSPAGAALTLVSASGAGITVAQSITNATTGATVTGLLAIDSKAAAISYGTDGMVNVYDPNTMLSRALRITSGGNDSGITFNVRGFDVFGFPMSENITGANAGIATGAKAWKYITSITPSAAAAGTVKVGTADIFGFPLRIDRFAYADIVWNNAAITANTGFVAAVTTSPATTTTGDVRGTYAVQSASDATKRLQAFISLDPTNIKTTTGTYGVTQV